jgi:hypothetical protein
VRRRLVNGKTNVSADSGKPTAKPTAIG